MPIKSSKNTLIVITGTTASGKTSLAVDLAIRLNGEIISADSRQVYREMNIGTGKDLEEYSIKGTKIPYHLIDIRNPGDHYDGYSFQKDFFSAYQDITSKGKASILCGGTGMYINLALEKEPLLNVNRNESLRHKLKEYSQEALIDELKKLNFQFHNKTDILDRERAVRAIEIETFKQNYKGEWPRNPIKDYLIFATNYSREDIRRRIRIRLDSRLEKGMLNEVVKLKENGLSSETLNYYGLEYKFINQYLEKEIGYDEMYTNLLQAIRRFAKKQMTWFRRMEKKGYKINWLDMNQTSEELVQKMAKIYEAV